MAVAERPTRTFRDLSDWLKRIDVKKLSEVK